MGGMATNDFVENLKILSLSQPVDAYSSTMKCLVAQLKRATPDGLLHDMPFTMALVDNFHRVTPIFHEKLLENDENARLTNLFLETVACATRNLCLLNLFLEIRSSYCLNTLFHRYVPLLKPSYFADDNRHDQLVNCLFPIVVYSSSLISVNEDNLPADFFTILLEFTKKNWQSETRKCLIQNILGFIKVASKTPALVPAVIHSEWPHACVQWLRTSGPRPPYKTDFLICLILQKLARHDIGVQVLNQLDCTKALHESKDQVRQDYDEEEYATIKFIRCITYTLLVEADQIKQNLMLADKLVIEVLDQLVLYIFQTVKEPTLAYRGCHISDILLVLSKLFVNDDILTKCFQDNSNLFDCLAGFLVDIALNNNSNDTSRVQKMLNEECLITLANLFWSISFHEAYHDQFKSNANLMQTLSNFATSSLLYVNTHVNTIPRDMVSLKKAAESILWNLKSSRVARTKDRSGNHSHIMISYSHSNSAFCHELVDHLSKHVPVWVDYQQEHHGSHHSDDLWEEIAAAMEMATVIVLVVSKEYYDSKSCRQELSYVTDTLKKRIVPVYAPNEQFKANGWLGIRIAGQKYVHFGKKTFANAIDELLTMINIEQQSPVVKQLFRKPVERENSIKDWTAKDIHKWFVDSHVHRDLITLFASQFHTGTALLVYAHHLKHFYQQEYFQILANYQKKFNGKRLQTVDFITFVDALWSLREKYDPQSKPEPTLENGIELTGEDATRL